MTETAWEQFYRYDVYLSELVLEELRGASSPLRASMLAAVKRFAILPITNEIQVLAARYVRDGIFPPRYFDDAKHVAVASVNGIGVLLSWNFAHLVKMKTRRMVALVNATENYMPVEIIAPPEL